MKNFKRINELKEEYKEILTEDNINGAFNRADFVTGMSYDGRIPEGAFERNFESELKSRVEK